MSKANCDKVVAKAVTFNTIVEGSDKKVAYDAFVLAPLFAGEPKTNKALFNSIFGEEGAKSFKAMLRQQLAYSFGTNELVELTGELVAEIAAAQALVAGESTPELLTKRQDDILVALNATVAEYYAEEIKSSADTELDDKGVPTWESEFLWVGSNCAAAQPTETTATEQPAPATEPTAQATEQPAPQEQVVETPTATTETPVTETPSNLPVTQLADGGAIINRDALRKFIVARKQQSDAALTANDKLQALGTTLNHLQAQWLEAMQNSSQVVRLDATQWEALEALIATPAIPETTA